MEQDYNLKKWSKGCPNTGINCRRSSCGIEYVFIPAALGDDQKGSPVAPKNGSYNNAVVYYEATGNVYLYSSDGVPTRVEKNLDSIIAELQRELNNVEEALSEETSAREAADAALDGRIDTVADNLATETANRISADEDLQADIAAEATARQNADTTLQNNITAETTARENGDAALNTAITSETTARQEADTNLQNQITQEAQARAAADTAINGAITSEAATRQTADAGLQSQIDAITASSDVKDIVGTKAELNNYDTSTLGDNDIVKVLQDESENNATTYYRWNATTQQFTLIGEEGPYYTKSQADTLLNAKQNTLTAGSNVQIVNDTISATDTTYTAGTGLALNGTQFSVDTATVATQSDLTAGLATKQDTLTAGSNIQINNNVISATDTTYSAFTGTDGTAAGTAGLVPAPATTDAGKFLKADGTWDTAGGGSGPTVVQTTGNSTTDVMSQNATSRMVFADPSSGQKVQIGNTGNKGANAVTIGATGTSYGNNSISLGFAATAGANNSVAFAGGTTTTIGVMQIGMNNTGWEGSGYNSSNYRLLTGLYDPQTAHDAATKGYVDSTTPTAYTSAEWDALWA